MSEARTFTAVIVDDEPAARAAVSTLLEDEPAVREVGVAINGDDAVRVVRELRPDLLFLDVQMPDRDGFGVIEALGADVPPGVIFVTAHDEHALRAFDVHALDYLLKPFGRPRFHAAVDRAVRRLLAEDAYSLGSTLTAMLQNRLATPEMLSASASDAKPLSRFAVKRGDRTLIVHVDEVEWIEAERDYVRLHTTSGVHLLAERMHGLEARLDDRNFHRIHRSVIVSLSRVRELRRAEDGGGVVILSSNVQLRVARNRWAGLESALHR